MNHKRAHPVTWSVLNTETSSKPSELGSTDCSLGLVSEVATQPGEEVLNNYGPKPNSSLILGYGFALPDNPDDTMSLKVASKGSRATHDSIVVGRNAEGAEELWTSVKTLSDLLDEEDDLLSLDLDGAKDVIRDKDVIDSLREMLAGLLSRLQEASGRKMESQDPVRANQIAVMHRYYLDGQLDIVRDLQAWVTRKEEVNRQRQQELGLVFEEDLSDEEDM